MPDNLPRDVREIGCWLAVVSVWLLCEVSMDQDSQEAVIVGEITRKIAAEALYQRSVYQSLLVEHGCPIVDGCDLVAVVGQWLDKLTVGLNVVKVPVAEPIVYDQDGKRISAVGKSFAMPHHVRFDAGELAVDAPWWCALYDRFDTLERRIAALEKPQ